MRVKIFTNAGDAPKLEKEINVWLNESKADILHIKQSYAYDIKADNFNAFISIWYNEQL